MRSTLSNDTDDEADTCTSGAGCQVGTEDHLGGGDADWLTTKAAAFLFGGCSNKRVLLHRDNGPLGLGGWNYGDLRASKESSYDTELAGRALHSCVPFFTRIPVYHWSSRLQRGAAGPVTSHPLLVGPRYKPICGQRRSRRGSLLLLRHPSRSSKGNPSRARITLVPHLPRSSAIDDRQILYCPRVRRPGCGWRDRWNSYPSYYAPAIGQDSVKH